MYFWGVLEISVFLVQFSGSKRMGFFILFSVKLGQRDKICCGISNE